MRHSLDPFQWTESSERAAQLLAEGRISDADVAEQVGVNRSTLYRWLKVKDFTDRIEERLDQFRREVTRRGIAVRERRVKALNDRWNRLQAVIEARADAPEMADAPGGTTGLLVRTVKGIGAGDNFQEVVEFTLDTGLLKELREHERQAAQELGQWTEKREVSGNPDRPLVVKTLKHVRMDDL